MRGDMQTDIQAYRQTERRTSQLIDWIGPEGQFSENESTRTDTVFFLLSQISEETVSIILLFEKYLLYI